MAQPSQVFPPWLTQSLVQVTDAAGAVATETTVVYVPPTYFGPSIPLGSLYIFGGTTEPATVVLPGASTSAVPSPITTTAIPPTTTLLTTTATPTITSVLTSISSSSTFATSTSASASSVSITSSLSENTSIQTSFSFSTGTTNTLLSSSTASPSSVAAIGHGSGLTRGQLVGVIVASILGLIFFFVLALFLYLCLKGRRNRRQFATLTPIDEDYFIVPPGGRLPGEGSPRHSGEEADPFLQQSSGSGGRGRAAAAGVGAAAMTQVPSQAVSRNGGNRVQPPPVPTNGSNSSGSTNSNASGFGVLLDRPSLGYLPVMPEHEHEHETVSGTPLSPVDMERIGREQVLPDESEQYPGEDYPGAYAYSMDPHAPPRLVEPTTDTPLLGGPARPPFASQSSRLSDKSSFEHENATLMVARRVKAEDLGSRSLSQQSESTAGPSNRPNSGLLAALGLSGLANLGRMSWFKNSESSSPRDSVLTPAPTRIKRSAERLSEKDVDVESGRSLLSPDINTRPADSFGQRPRANVNVGTGPDGLRPHSSVSARSGTSGGTIYHDAASSIPGTPLLAAPPRALTPTDAVAMPSEHAWMSSPLAHSNQPPAYSNTVPVPSSTPSPPPPAAAADILDMPAPTALNHFSSISSIKETPTGSSFSSKPPPFLPPGLDTIRPVGWSTDGRQSPTTTDMTTSRGSFGRSYGLMGTMGMGHVDAITIDILEEAPPDAEHGWRTLAASGGFVDAGRRTTFGLYTPGSGVASEQGSLHSMASDFTRSMRSTGSAAASRRDVQGSIGSNSSRPSAHSVAQSMGSGFSVAHSLVRQGSLTSDDRRRGSNSPALSAFGIIPQSRAASALGREVYIQDRAHASSASVVPPEALAPTIGSPPSAHMSPDKTGTIRSVGSGSTTVMMDSNNAANTSFSSTLHAGAPTERSVSPLSMTFSMDAPWAGGLDSNWQPTAAP